MRNRKGFTLVEAVVTIGVLGLCSAMIIGTIVSLVNIQKTSVNQNVRTSELTKIDSLCNDYVSFISQENFTFSSSSESEVVFTFDTTYNASLIYNSNESSLTFSTNYPEETNYFYRNEKVSLDSSNKIVFNYDSTNKLLFVDSIVNEKHNRVSYIVRSN